jgi:manganese transport protein
MTARTLAFPVVPALRRRPARRPWRRALALVGPGYLVAVGYMDPGNWAVDIAGGAAARYGLLAVVLAASLAAMFVQDLVVRLTVATGRDLASLMRERLPRPLSLAIWLASEVAIVATELAELLGGAIAFKLLLGLPLTLGALATAAITLVLMIGPIADAGRIERVVGLLVAAVALGVAAQLALVRPDFHAVLAGFVPTADIVREPQLLYLALGILGATVMPHNLYLHSGLVRDRLSKIPTAERTLAGRIAAFDSCVALTLAFLVNAAILVVAGAVLPGVTGDVGLETAPRLLAGAVGTGAAAILFAGALLAAGQSSTITGALAGQLVLQGFLARTMPAWLRLALQRGAALVLALVLLAGGGDSAGDRLLILSQVVLSLTLPAVLLPLAWLAGRSAGSAGIGAFRRAGAWGFAVVLTGLNLYLLPGLLAA